MGVLALTSGDGSQYQDTVGALAFCLEPRKAARDIWHVQPGNCFFITQHSDTESHQQNGVTVFIS